ncbi:ISL3 family transposase (plasmid) [Roseomonas sp. CCTCC AB2023176]|uniref:ISL3 family transposase n=1 Tax=Roseomonas sp. CCTCC AB2023176 TaxID=3342640 RepID=UPI0035DD11A7
MRFSISPSTPVGVRITRVDRSAEGWIVDASGPGQGACSDCGVPSRARHGSYLRHLQDLPIQGRPVAIALRVVRLRCRNLVCNRRTFAEPLLEVAEPMARRTSRLADILHSVSHALGGRPAERLLARLGMPSSDDTFLRMLRRRAIQGTSNAPRVLGIDDWAWSKGQRSGTILVDLERRTVVDLLPDRSSASTEAWLVEHPGAEFISRDRHGLYAEGARAGAPGARQVADRFHLVQTLREKIEGALGRLDRPVRRGTVAAAEAEERRALRRGELENSFARMRDMHEAGRTAADIVRELGLSRRRLDKWLRLTGLPERNAMASGPRSPALFDAHLRRRWREGCTVVRRLFVEIQRLGYAGCYTYLARYVAAWRRGSERKGAPPSTAASTSLRLPCHPDTGRRLSPQVAAALCLKPRPQLNARQAAAVDALKHSVPDFTALRRMAMRFRGVLRGHDVGQLDCWLRDAHESGIYAMRRFARTLQGDIDAVRNAVTQPWSNGTTEGQISRLKTLKRSMGGRAGCELLRARMLPLQAAP